MKQPFLYQLTDFDHPTATSSFTVIVGEQKFPITDLPDGTRPDFILVANGNDTGYEVAVGDSAIDASTDPQFWLSEGMNAVCLHVTGMTHVSVNSTVSAAMTMSILGND